jgi:hypothetical protein
MKERCEMKGRLAAFVGVFCIAMLIVSGAYAGKPSKEPKPPKPGDTTKECIVFTGDLEGSQIVEGCCPNAGPFPAYTMTLRIEELPLEVWGKTFEGDLFAKPVTTRVKGQKTERYIVQFLTWDWETGIPGDGDFFIEVFSDGDDIAETDNVLTVTFDNDHEDDTVTVWKYYDMNGCDPCDPDCDLCGDFEPNCDDLCDPDCPYPCNEEITVEDVSFVLVRTSDLSYCED